MTLSDNHHFSQLSYTPCSTPFLNFQPAQIPDNTLERKEYFRTYRIFAASKNRRGWVREILDLNKTNALFLEGLLKPSKVYFLGFCVLKYSYIIYDFFTSSFRMSEFNNDFYRRNTCSALFYSTHAILLNPTT